MSRRKLTERQREAKDEALWVQIDDLRRGAKELFRKAIEAHREACDIHQGIPRGDALGIMDATIAAAQRLLEMAADKAAEAYGLYEKQVYSDTPGEVPPA